MHIAFVDLEQPPQPQGEPVAAEPSFGKGPQRVASPALLCRAALARGEGHTVSYHRLAAAALAEPVERARLAADRLVVRCASSELRGLAEDVIERFDPFEPGDPGAPWQGAPPAYELAKGKADALAEAESAPPGESLHPWVLPSIPVAPRGESDAHVAKSVAALCGEAAPQLYLNDERVRLDMTRLRALGELTRGALRDHKTMIELHLRVWPEDLLGERIIDHLALLPVVSLDLLAGSLHGPSLRRGGSALSPADVARCAAEVLRGGLAHLCRLSLVLGMPGEAPEQCAAMVSEALRLAMSCRIPRLRLSFWLGEEPGSPPSDAAGQERRFLAAHPDWHAVEYRGVLDLVSLSAMAYPQIKVVGPGMQRS